MAEGRRRDGGEEGKEEAGERERGSEMERLLSRAGRRGGDGEGRVGGEGMVHEGMGGCYGRLRALAALKGGGLVRVRATCVHE